MIRWVALFRGINVGGNNKLPMADLRALASGLGHESVATYIQSGNLVFSSPTDDGAQLETALAAAVEARFGFRPIIILRTMAQLAEALAANPFAAQVTEGKQLHLFFCEGSNPRYHEPAMRALATPTEDFAMVGDVFYLFAPDGIGRSKLAEKLPLPKRNTARNLNSIQAILALA